MLNVNAFTVWAGDRCALERQITDVYLLHNINNIFHIFIFSWLVIDGGTVVKCLVLSPHSTKVHGSNPPAG